MNGHDFCCLYQPDSTFSQDTSVREYAFGPAHSSQSVAAADIVSRDVFCHDALRDLGRVGSRCGQRGRVCQSHDSRGCVCGGLAGSVFGFLYGGVVRGRFEALDRTKLLGSCGDPGFDGAEGAAPL